MTRCKFVCVAKNAKEAKDTPTTYDVSFQAVTDGSEENKKFWQYTPSGYLTFNSVNVAQFQVGKEYYLDFSEAVAAPEAVPEVQAEPAQ